MYTSSSVLICSKLFDLKMKVKSKHKCFDYCVCVYLM